jgi:ABC-type lipoprotein release transport system permease subunit
MNKFITLAWRNMWRNWRRTTIALVAIILGLILLLFLDGIIKGSDQAIFGNAIRLYGGSIQVHAPGYVAKIMRLPLLPLENADLVVQTARTNPQVVAAAKRINTSGFVSSRASTYPVRITGIEPSVEQPHSMQAEHIVAGQFLQDSDSDTIVIGQRLAELLKAGVGDRITLVGRRKNETMRQHSMTIVGIYDLSMPDIEKGAVFIPLADAQTLYNLRGQATEVAITLKQVEETTNVVNSLAPALPGYEVNSWDTLRPEMRQVLETKAAYTSFLGLIVLMIASIGILNLMLMAIFERTREMGVMAALGLKGRQIMGLFLMEGSLIGVVGALVGGLIGALLLILSGRVGFDISSTAGMGEITAMMGSRIYPALTIASIIRWGLAVIIIAAIASFYPAWQASRKEPADALHHV